MYESMTMNVCTYILDTHKRKLVLSGWPGLWWWTIFVQMDLPSTFHFRTHHSVTDAIR